jgi:hypothetical protein
MLGRKLIFAMVSRRKIRPVRGNIFARKVP